MFSNFPGMHWFFWGKPLYFRSSLFANETACEAEHQISLLLLLQIIQTNLDVGVAKINFLDRVDSFVTRSEGQPVADELAVNRVPLGRTPRQADRRGARILGRSYSRLPIRNYKHNKQRFLEKEKIGTKKV